MLSLVLILLSLHSIGQIACQGEIVYPLDANDGDPCTLTSGGVGQCQRFSECGRKYSDRRTICGFFGNEPIICCDVVRRQCEGIRPTMRRISDHVVGDVHTADVGEFPFMALITYINAGYEVGDEDLSHHRCGAALLSTRFLLTAAHCIKTDLIPYAVKLGTNDATDAGADSYLIDTVYVHEENKKRQNDIGIVKLVKDIALNDQIKPICVYTNPEELSESVDLTVMGWGIGNDEELSGVLLKGTVHPVPRSICQARFNAGLSKRIQLQDTHMCALGDKNENGTATDTCQGDSGGPMVLKEDDQNYLVAIVSTGQGCGSEHYAGVYTRVNKFLPWIIEKGVFLSL
ncbi:CLIP domain-containing serine protease C9-like isoform X2 [Ochlerotatus camptorhynchus]|uniref:CLIP domain-containing serine protease C9-like isoform X2 n=1 Tax=Ochlerotatus camptorhynchus TaxID=644619 RepID=UPI0031DE7354